MRQRRVSPGAQQQLEREAARPVQCLSHQHRRLGPSVGALLDPFLRMGHGGKLAYFGGFGDGQVAKLLVTFLETEAESVI